MRSGLHFPPKDVPLREDVRRLGALVGEVLREQGGDELFDRVEAARRGAIERREQGGAEPLFEAALGTGQAAELIRAFSLYFQIINLAEKAHRVRRRREYLKRPDAPQRGSFLDLMLRLKSKGVEVGEIEELLAALSIEPVFTAHPTEATRRAILEKQQQIARRLIELFDFSATPTELRVNAARIRSEVTCIWQTEAQPPSRTTVLGELEHVLYYLMDVIYKMVPFLYEELESALDEVYGGKPTVPIFLRFASWVGGDMDGNPNVTAQTLRAALARQRDVLLERYVSELLGHARSLTQTSSRVSVDPELLELSAGYGDDFPEVVAAISAREVDMPYRRLFRLIAARVGATLSGGDRGYSGPDELRRDLRIAATSLERNAAEHAGLFALRRTLRRVDTFGFHLAAIDVRQDAGVHRQAVAALMNDPAWIERPAAERTAALTSALEGELEVVEGEGDTGETLAVFREIREAQARLGPGAIGSYVISMARGPDDVLSVLYLARRAGLAAGSQVPLDVAPLFETVADLENAGVTMDALFANDLYRGHLRARSDRQTVMVGYSDSNKDGGLTASRWALYEAQENLVGSFDRAGVRLTIFHGRGGSISRGGGKTHRAVMAAPSGSVAGRLRATEQGEVIDDSYSLRPIAARSLERATGAVVLATLRPSTPLPDDSRWRQIAATIAGQSRTTYRDLVYVDGFDGYFRAATPIDVIERMEIGSRPASRRQGGGIESLRAIPWVFSWTQSRHLLPGWYGLGSGLDRAIEEFGIDSLREMLEGWLFFAVLLDDAEMVLGKADMSIARRYAELAGDSGRRTFGVIEAEFDRTVARILEIKRNEVLLDDDPVLQRAIRLRNPYIDPMSELQIDLLCRWRKAGRNDGELLGALRASVRGIAYGLQNTG